jgi:hypothetical protein
MAPPRILTLLLLPTAIFAQACYYPDGSPVTAEPVAPCNATSAGDAVACCPLRWTCLSNLLCALPEEGMLGRYSCTDSEWGSPNCPGFCTKSKRHGRCTIHPPCF